MERNAQRIIIASEHLTVLRLQQFWRLNLWRFESQWMRLTLKYCFALRDSEEQIWDSISFAGLARGKGFPKKSLKRQEKERIYYGLIDLHLLRRIVLNKDPDLIKVYPKTESECFLIKVEVEVKIKIILKKIYKIFKKRLSFVDFDFVCRLYFVKLSQDNFQWILIKWSSIFLDCGILLVVLKSSIHSKICEFAGTFSQDCSGSPARPSCSWRKYMKHLWEIWKMKLTRKYPLLFSKYSFST